MRRRDFTPYGPSRAATDALSRIMAADLTGTGIDVNLLLPGGAEDRRICVSGLYVARNEAGRAVDALAGQPLRIPRPLQPAVDVMYISWHHQQVFKGAMPHAESTA